MKKIIKNILQYIAVIVISLVIAILLRLFVVDFYSIPSDSMQPTIEPGDFIMVNKLSFGARMYKNFDFLKDRTEPEFSLFRRMGQDQYAPFPFLCQTLHRYTGR